MALREAQSFCQICPGHCGVILTLDEDDRIVNARADRAHALSKGYACNKGLATHEMYYGPQRLLNPLKRMPDGSYATIGLTQALDEIAERLRVIIDRDGPDAVAAFKGTGVYMNALSGAFFSAFLPAIGSSSIYSALTIDHSSLFIALDRIGMWGGGKRQFHNSDVMVILGANPLLAITLTGFDMFNPMKKMKAFKARGGKLIVIDPRRTETAQFADIFIQPRPGEDVTIVAGMLRIILSNGWEDREFCARYVDQLDALREAVEPFTLEYVARRADISPDQLVEATRCFAQTPRAFATAGTGPSMGPRSNLAEHLIQCLDIVCGHVLREGERVPNPGLYTQRPWRAEVFPPTRSWEKSPKSRVRGLGRLMGEKMAGALAQEITTPGPEQVKALISFGGNPATAIPDQARIVSALKALDLLVAVDPVMSATARLAHYILPPTLHFEKTEVLASAMLEGILLPEPFQQYGAPIAKAPAGSDLIDDWAVFWELARRLGAQIVFDGIPLDMTTRPADEALLSLLFRNGRVSFEEIKKYPGGRVFEVETYVAPAPESTTKFEVAAPDVVEEIARVAAEDFGRKRRAANGQELDLLLTGRRLRDTMNSALRNFPITRKRTPYNAAYLHPDELAARNLSEGDYVDITSDNGTIQAIVEADPTLRRGIVSMSHAWGGLPGEDADYETEGACTGLLISTERDCEEINWMPRMSTIPVRIDITQRPIKRAAE